MSRRNKDKVGRQDIITLEEGTDARVCKDLLGGKMVKTSCVLVTTGVGEDGDIHLKKLRNIDEKDE